MNHELNEPKTAWGGSWTDKKLLAFIKYVKAYLIILRKYPNWSTIYFDGFAGSGTREKATNSELKDQLSIIEEEEFVYQGAAEQLLHLDDTLRFNWYYFIDKDENASKELEEKLSFVDDALKKQLVFRNGDCNEQLQELAGLMHGSDKFAALIFLDPFGMQIEWENIANLKGTRTDIWILLPTGVIINRLLDRKAELKSIALLCQYFGLSEEEIRMEFYNTKTETDLFGVENEVIEKVMDPINKIAMLYIKRMETVWKFVTPKPLRLNNSTGSPIFHFIMASNNADANRIAQEIIEKT